MTAVPPLLENLVDETQSVKLHFFFAVLLIGRSYEWWSGPKYQYAPGCLRLFLNQFMASSGSGNEAHACASSSTMFEIDEPEPCVCAAFEMNEYAYFCFSREYTVLCIWPQVLLLQYIMS